MSAAQDSVQDTIDKAWDAADAAIEQSTNYTQEAVNYAKSFLSSYSQDFKVQLPASYEVDANIDSKLLSIRSDTNTTLSQDIPDAYNALFRDLLANVQNLTMGISNGSWSAQDTVDVIGSISSAWNSAFAFGDGNNMQESMNDLATFLSTGLVYGGTPEAPYGLPAATEQAIRDRAYDSLANEALKNEDEAVAAFAARGFPVPPGMLAARVAEVQDKNNTDKSNVARDVAIDQAKRGFEAGQRYLQQFQSLQQQAAAAFNDYLQLAITARAGASDDMKALVASIVEMRNSVVKLYAYTMDERETLLKQAIADGSLTMRQRELDVSNFQASVGARSQTAIGAAQMMGTLAASAIGSQNTMANISHKTVAEDTGV